MAHYDPGFRINAEREGETLDESPLVPEIRCLRGHEHARIHRNTALTAAPKQLLLLGGGHAHLEVLRQLCKTPLRSAHVTLVSAFGEHHYSSLVPGYLQGREAERDFTFDLRTFCHAAGATFVEGCAESIKDRDRSVMVRPTMAADRDEDPARTPAQDIASVPSDDGITVLRYDVLSIDVGSSPAALSTPGVGEHAATVRPMTKAIALKRRLDVLIANAKERRSLEGRRGANGRCSVPICVVGAGAGGVEITLAVARRLREAEVEGPITLIDRSPRLLPDFPLAVQTRIACLLEQCGVHRRLDCRVRAVEATAVQFDDGTRLDALLTIWVTGAAAPPLLDHSAMATADDGFLLVDDMLRAVQSPYVWGAGDCVSVAAHPFVAKAGVLAVREDPVLAHNLLVALEGGRLRRYRPQRHFLAILNTGDGRALLRWRGLSSHSRWALALKRWIDRRFVRRYQRVTDALSVNAARRDSGIDGAVALPGNESE
ncbi:MAG: FAD-dependent oxidoreductase [Gemmatimonadaceae bacterium]